MKELSTIRRSKELLKEALEIDLNIGDIVLGGRFKNRREIVKTLSKDSLGQYTINGKKLLNFRIEKNLPKDKWSKKTKDLSKKASVSSLIDNTNRRRILKNMPNILGITI